MATLLELKTLFNDSDLQDKVQVALIIAVQAILDAAPTLSDQKYAAYVFAAPRAEAKKALMSVLATSNAATVAQIQGASEAQLKNNVAAVIDTLRAAYNAGVI